MNTKINWDELREKFEKDMAKKLRSLPGHREVPESLQEFRGIISHELPETSDIKIYNELTNLLLTRKAVDVDQIRRRYLLPELHKESQLLKNLRPKFIRYKRSARSWVTKYLSEDQLQIQWKQHQTWLPRRYTIYKVKEVPFETIAADTLARYKSIKENENG